MNARELMMNIDKPVHITPAGQRIYYNLPMSGTCYLTGYSKQRITRDNKRVDVWCGYISWDLAGSVTALVGAEYIELGPSPESETKI